MEKSEDDILRLKDKLHCDLERSKSMLEVNERENVRMQRNMLEKLRQEDELKDKLNFF